MIGRLQHRIPKTWHRVDCDLFHLLRLTVAPERFHTARIARGREHQHQVVRRLHLIRARVPAQFPCAVR